MPIELNWEGLDEFRMALRNLPADLSKEAVDIVRNHAEIAATQIRLAYPYGPTGNLKRGVVVAQGQSSLFSSTWIVRSRAPHAHLFEFGTKERRNRKGAGRGRMPRAPENEAMIPIAMKIRRRMYMALVPILEKAGFAVYGQAA